MSPGSLYRALQDEQAITVVDVRNLAAYEQAHISGAIHLPIEELAERAGELDGNKATVFYCLSPNEAMSLQAAMILYRLGFTNVSILDGGIQEWYSDGYPIEGTILTPTPRFIGPPWTVTPLVTITGSPPADDSPSSTPRTVTGTPRATVTRRTQ
jgi:rhodanese-related sulfurtransferase